MSASSWFDEWWFEGAAGSGLLVEVVHLTMADAHDGLIDDLLAAHGVPHGNLLAFAAALACGRPLAGSAEALGGLRGSVITSRSVAAEVVRRHGQIDHFWRWRMYVERSNPHGLRTHFGGVVSALTHMTCALNGRWWPGAKWPGWTLADVPISPPDLPDRLTQIDRLDPATAAASLAELVEQTYDLVAEHLPEADPERLRSVFRFARKPWPRR